MSSVFLAPAVLAAWIARAGMKKTEKPVPA